MSTLAKSVKIRVSALRSIEPYSCYYCLDSRFISCLLALSERLFWKSTWINDQGEREQLTDQEYALLNEGVYALMQCQTFDDIQNQINMLVHNINNLANQIGDNNMCCCCNCGNNGTTLPGGNQPPPGGSTNPVPPPTPQEPQTATQIHKCNAGNYIIDGLLQFIAEVRYYAPAAGMLTWAVIQLLMLATGVMLFFQPIATALLDILLTGGIENMCDQITAILNAERANLVNAMKQATSQANAKYQCQQITNSSANGTTQAKNLLHYLWESVDWNVLFDEEFDVPSYPECESVPEPEDCMPALPAGYGYVQPFDISNPACGEQTSEYTTVLTIEGGESSGCEDVMVIHNEFQFSDTNQTHREWFLVQPETNIPNKVGIVYYTRVNQCPGGNSPAGYVARVGFTLNDGCTVSGGVEHQPGQSLMFCTAAELATLSPYFTEAHAADGSFDFDTDSTMCNNYRRVGVTGVPGGLNIHEFSVAYIVKL